MIILAGVIVVGLVNNNPISKAMEAKNVTNLKAIESKLYLYITNQFSQGKTDLDLFPILRDNEGNPISADDYYSDSVKSHVSDTLATILSSMILKRIQI